MQTIENLKDLAVKDLCWIDYDGSSSPYLCGLVRDYPRRSLKTVTLKKVADEHEATVWANMMGLNVISVGDFLDKYSKYYAHHMQWDG